MASENWVERYADGDRQSVWAELRALGDEVRGPAYADAARAVCDEAARRARANVETLVGRLTAGGFRFHSNDSRRTPEPPHGHPSASAAEHARWLDDTFGGVPMLLDSWVRLVGDVWLVGTHPGWAEADASDPFVIEAEGTRAGEPDGEAIQGYFEDDYEGWKEWADEDPDADPFVLPLAPDALHKSNTSGGDPYGLVLPDRGADGNWSGETVVSFVAYLNDVFAHGGFPGVAADDDVGQRITNELAAGLLEL
jgi:hypothetical protein